MRHQYSKQGEDVGVLALIDHLEELEKDARQNSELRKADNAWAMESYDTLKAELEKARELLRDAAKHRGIQIGSCGIGKRIVTFLEGSK